MKCKLAAALVVLAALGYAGWRYYDWAVTNFDVQGP
jgi:hypothetical protein